MTITKAILTGLQANHFRHPLDLQATRALQQLPGLDLAVRSLLGSVAEQVFYLDNIASSVQVGERQLPHLHQLLLDACKILDMEPPQLYIRQHPAPNAYTFAMRSRQPFIVVHTSLLELLTDEEIQAVIAHELGHLKCDHGVYLTPLNLLILVAAQVPGVGIWLAQMVQTQMLEWLRCAEFTCDRSALLVVQDPRIVASLLMKLTGGSPSLAPKLNLDAFLEQARTYDRLSSTELGELIRAAQTQALTHPLPVLRAREIDRWASTHTYQSLLKSRPIEYNGETKSKGGWRNW